jgi:hypothetical protein
MADEGSSFLCVFSSDLYASPELDAAMALKHVDNEEPAVVAFT